MQPPPAKYQKFFLYGIGNLSQKEVVICGADGLEERGSTQKNLMMIGRKEGRHKGTCNKPKKCVSEARVEETGTAQTSSLATAHNMQQQQERSPALESTGVAKPPFLWV